MSDQQECNQLAGAIAQWSEVHKTITRLRVEEMSLRKQIVAAVFPTRQEGAQSHYVPGNPGWLVKASVKLTRTIDQAALPAVAELLPEGSGDRLVLWKPSLRIKEYKALPSDQRAIFDQALVIKEGAPTLTAERTAH